MAKVRIPIVVDMDVNDIVAVLKDDNWEPVVYCKDCKYFKQIWGNRQSDACRRVDPLNPIPTHYWGFCSFGEDKHEHTD